MRTAEERVTAALGGNMNIGTLKLAFWYEIIREAQIEAIQECAKNAKAFTGVNDEPLVSTGSILKLIDQVK